MSGRFNIHSGKFITVFSKVHRRAMVQSWFQCLQMSYKDLTLLKGESEWFRRDIIDLGSFTHTWMEEYQGPSVSIHSICPLYFLYSLISS